MAVGKNKRLSKGKKSKGKKSSDPYLRKEWYDIKTPANFQTRNIGKTMINRTQGTRIASEELKGRVFEVSLADLMQDESYHYRKVSLRCEDVRNREVLTNFYGMSLTTDKLRSLVKKWQTTIEAFTDVKTKDGFILRLFCLGFTRRRQNQVRKTSYAMTSQIRAIRKRMVQIIQREASVCSLRQLVDKLIKEKIGKRIERSCSAIFPMYNVFIRKVKMLKTPKMDASKLVEHYGLASEDTGAAVAVAAPSAAPASAAPSVPVAAK